MPPETLPTLSDARVALRPFRDADAALVPSAAEDPRIPLITTVPTTGALNETLAYIARQHDRLHYRAGYSFAIVELDTGEPVGQIGLWLANTGQGRASTGYWVAFRCRGLGSGALAVLVDWALSLAEAREIDFACASLAGSAGCRPLWSV